MKVVEDTLDIPNDPTPWVLVKPNENKEWCVLWLQGWTSTIESHLEGITRMTKNSNTAFAMLDYAGHGEHPKDLDSSTKEIQFTEVCAAYDTLKQLGYGKIVVIGGSFGGYMAALIAGSRDPAAVVLRAPAIYPDHEFSLPYSKTLRYEDYQVHAKFKQIKKTYAKSKAISSIASYTGSVFVMQHEIDSIIPRGIPESYFEAAKQGNYIVVPKTDHSPKLMSDPLPHYALIEHWIVSIISAVKLGDALA